MPTASFGATEMGDNIQLAFVFEASKSDGGIHSLHPEWSPKSDTPGGKWFPWLSGPFCQLPNPSHAFSPSLLSHYTTRKHKLSSAHSPCLYCAGAPRLYAQTHEGHPTLTVCNHQRSLFVHHIAKCLLCLRICSIPLLSPTFFCPGCLEVQSQI
jgi:hypothetical protein